MQPNKDKQINNFRQPTYCKCNVVCRAGKINEMETIFYIVCYQYFDGRKAKKANACFKQSELVCDQYSNALREIERLLGDKEDLLILCVSRVETIASDADASSW